MSSFILISRVVACLLAGAVSGLVLLAAFQAYLEPGVFVPVVTAFTLC